MSIFFKISKDARHVYFIKTILNKDRINKKEFEKKALKVTSERFLEKCPHLIRERMKNVLLRIEKFNKMDLFEIGRDVYFNGEEIKYIYYIGDEVLTISTSDFKEREFASIDNIVKNKIIELYGEEFYFLHKDNLFKKWQYFLNGKEIGFEEYYALRRKVKILLQIYSMRDYVYKSDEEWERDFLDEERKKNTLSQKESRWLRK